MGCRRGAAASSLHAALAMLLQCTFGLPARPFCSFANALVNGTAGVQGGGPLAASQGHGAERGQGEPPGLYPPLLLAGGSWLVQPAWPLLCHLSSRGPSLCRIAARAPHAAPLAPLACRACLARPRRRPTWCWRCWWRWRRAPTCRTRSARSRCALGVGCKRGGGRGKGGARVAVLVALAARTDLQDKVRQEQVRAWRGSGPELGVLEGGGGTHVGAGGSRSAHV